jgi:threonine dehydratase
MSLVDGSTLDRPNFKEPPLQIQLSNVLDAHNALNGRIVRTPLIHSLPLSEETGANIWLKPEHWQLTGSFKIRGAYYRMSRLSTADRARGVITASAGNHAQGVALAGRLLGISALVVVPLSAPETKVDNIKRLGAEVVCTGDNYDASETAALDLAQRTGRVFVHAYEDSDVAAGQGTVGLEMLTDHPELDVLIVPAGGGGLICGIGAVARAVNPSIQVLGVQSEASAGWYESWQADRVVAVEYQETWAEGLLGAIGRENFAFARNVADGFEVVSEADIRRAMRWAIDHHHWVVEGSGAVGVAWALNRGASLAGRSVGIVISGGNVDTARLAALLRN